MKKRIIIVLTAAALLAGALAACGSKGSDNGGETAQSSSAESEPAAEIFDVGEFTVAVPAGWKAIQTTDILAEQDEDGNYPFSTDEILIAKGDPADELDARMGPNVIIHRYDPNTIVLDMKDFYDNVEDISGVSYNGVDCETYSGETMGYTYQFIAYVPDDDAQYRITVLTSVDGKDTGISWDDTDVVTIISSLP